MGKQYRKASNKRGVYKRKSGGGKFMLRGITRHPKPFSTTIASKDQKQPLLNNILEKMGFRVGSRQ